MTIYSIYTATNIITNKVYVGFTSNFKRRVRNHKSLYLHKTTKLYTSIRKHGWECFQWKEIYNSTDKNHCLNSMEQYFIEFYDSINSGYNMNEGGSGVLGVVAKTIWINDGKNNKRIKNNSPLPDGWNYGRTKTVRKIKMSDDTKRLISSKIKSQGVFAKLNCQKTPCPYCGLSMNIGNLSRHIKYKH